MTLRKASWPCLMQRNLNLKHSILTGCCNSNGLGQGHCGLIVAITSFMRTCTRGDSGR